MFMDSSTFSTFFDFDVSSFCNTFFVDSSGNHLYNFSRDFLKCSNRLFFFLLIFLHGFLQEYLRKVINEFHEGFSRTTIRKYFKKLFQKFQQGFCKECLQVFYQEVVQKIYFLISEEIFPQFRHIPPGISTKIQPDCKHFP